MILKYRLIKNKNGYKTLLLRLTNGNCKMPCSGILGFVRLGHGFAIPTPHSTTFFFARKTLRVFLIRAGKTSVT